MPQKVATASGRSDVGRLGRKICGAMIALTMVLSLFGILASTVSATVPTVPTLFSPADNTGKTSTTLSISLSSFTENSGGSRTLVATLKDKNNNPLAGKTLTWLAENGSISPSSGTTDSAGEVSVTYTAPTVVESTWVEIIVFFDGDDQYQQSVGDSVVLIIGEEPFSTSLSISPSTFSLYTTYLPEHRQEQFLIATLRGEYPYMAPAGKTITWSTSFGSFSPVPSDAVGGDQGGTAYNSGQVFVGTTNSEGLATVIYTAQGVTAETPQVTITASFAGDDQYGPSSGTSYGIPDIDVSPIATAMENILASTGGIVSLEVLQSTYVITSGIIAENGDIITTGVQTGGLLENVFVITKGVLEVRENVLSEDTTITMAVTPPVDLSSYAMVSGIFDIGPSGTTFTTPATLTLSYDENELPEGVSEEDLAVYRRVGNTWENLGGSVDSSANTVSMEIDHLSEYAVMAQLTPPAEGIPLAALLAILGVALVVIIAAAWIGLRQARGEATTELIKHGFSSMSIQGADVFREIRGHKEFTIPELMHETGASQTLTRRTVQKLIKKGIVKRTGEVKLAEAGRGKPSRVYKYVGEES